MRGEHSSASKRMDRSRTGSAHARPKTFLSWTGRVASALLLATSIDQTASSARSARAGQPSGSDPSAPQSQSLDARNEAFIRAAFDRWAAGGTGFFDEVIDPQVTWRVTGSGPGTGTCYGRAPFVEKVIAPFAKLFASPIRPEVVASWSARDQTVVHWIGTGSTRAGKAYRNEYVWIFRLRGERAVEVTAFLDLDAYRAVYADAGTNPVDLSRCGAPSDGPERID